MLEWNTPVKFDLNVKFVRILVKFVQNVPDKFDTQDPDKFDNVPFWSNLTRIVPDKFVHSGQI